MLSTALLVSLCSTAPNYKERRKSDICKRNIRSKYQGSLNLEGWNVFSVRKKGDDLREEMTMKLNNRVNECARTHGDRKLLAKWSVGDFVAQKLNHHPTCRIDLYIRERAYLNA